MADGSLSPSCVQPAARLSFVASHFSGAEGVMPTGRETPFDRRVVFQIHRGFAPLPS
ncbi:hypothetical protein [Faunimonas pinastri]|uniref:hypothetical protein n=1 Tax=Faunimonas pinastri TaxID=1855383 RepID=UPI0015A711BA|nr:hypothetical protein [Faunimonas pinastri]